MENKEIEEPCSWCKGSGSVLNALDNTEDCPVCKGTGRLKASLAIDRKEVKDE